MLERNQSERNFRAEFKKEWSWIETKGAEAIIKEYFEENYDIDNIDEEFLGLAYTSSSSFAGLFAIGSRFEIEEGINLEYFAITENNQLIAVGQDAEEKEYYYHVD